MELRPKRHKIVPTMASVQGGLMGRSLAPPSGHQSHQQRTRQMSLICCNRCRKPLTAQFFVMLCDCAFCEDCTYEHFQNHTHCPSCRKELTQKDIFDVMVAEPSASSEAIVKNTIQYIFNKRVVGSKGIGNVDLCARFIKLTEAHCRTAKFLLRQLVYDASIKELRAEALKTAYDKNKDEITQHKQDIYAQQQQYDQQVAELQSQMSAMSMTIQEQASQLKQLRKMFAQQNIDFPPTLDIPHGSGGRRGSSQSQSVHAKQQTSQPVSLQNKYVSSYQSHMNPQATRHDRPAPAIGNDHYQQQQHSRVSLGSTTSGVRPISFASRNGFQPFTPIQVPFHQHQSGSEGSVTSINSFGSKGGSIRDPRHAPKYAFGLTSNGRSSLNSGRSRSPSARFHQGAHGQDYTK